MVACYALNTCPILFIRRAYTFFCFIIIISSSWARLALQTSFIIISVVWAFYALISWKKWKIYWTRNTFLDFNIIDLFIWTIFTCFIRKIKEFRVETSYTLFSIKIFFLSWTLTLFWILIVYFFEWALLTILNRNVEICIISWAWRTSFIY